jgi:putative redox protein
MARIEIKRVDDDYAFEATDTNNHSLRMDAAETIGGHNSGIRPMQTLLSGLGGCSGVDIISILKKQRQEVKDFTMVIDGEREEGKEPSLWKHIHIQFTFTGNIDADKAAKACALSLDKYCSVAATLRAAGCTIEWDVEIAPS